MQLKCYHNLKSQLVLFLRLYFALFFCAKMKSRRILLFHHHYQDFKNFHLVRLIEWLWDELTFQVMLVSFQIIEYKLKSGAKTFGTDFSLNCTSSLRPRQLFISTGQKISLRDCSFCLLCTKLMPSLFEMTGINLIYDYNFGPSGREALNSKRPCLKNCLDMI